MNKRLISRLMCARVSELRNSGVYFFRGDFEHILTGVVLEYTPRGLYIWDYRFPLFDFANPMLLYSERMPERAFIGKEEMSEEALVNHVMALPQVQAAFGRDKPMGLEEFVQFLLESDCLLNPHAQLIHAAALALLGQEARAADVLDELLPKVHPSDISHCEMLRASLQQGPETTRKLLDQVREKNLRTLGVS